MIWVFNDSLLYIGSGTNVLPSCGSLHLLGTQRASLLVGIRKREEESPGLTCPSALRGIRRCHFGLSGCFSAITQEREHGSTENWQSLHFRFYFLFIFLSSRANCMLILKFLYVLNTETGWLYQKGGDKHTLAQCSHGAGSAVWAWER